MSVKEKRIATAVVIVVVAVVVIAGMTKFGRLLPDETHDGKRMGQVPLLDEKVN